MSTPATISDTPAPAAKPNSWSSIALVFCCTLLGATAQILMKVGAGHLGPDGLVGYFKAMPGSVLANPGLFTGYVLYGMSTLLLVLALKDGELSMLYPVIALTYVWVTAAAFLIFHDTVKPVRLVGIVIIVAGVAVLGRAGKK